MRNLYSQTNRLPDAIDRLAGAVERLSVLIEGLGPVRVSSYTPTGDSNDDLLDEGAMAEKLRITRRTLGQYRRQGKLPGCWVRNGRQVRWHVEETLEAWKRGIA